jgi:hypothetical protein
MRGAAADYELDCIAANKQAKEKRPQDFELLQKAKEEYYANHAHHHSALL